MTTPSARAAGSLAGPASWQLDPAGSSVTFQHKTIWGLATVRGTFSKLSGTGAIAADGSASGRIVIEAASLDTKHGARDKHLRSADFFNADEHPHIVAVLQRASLAGGTDPAVSTGRTGDQVTVTGQLTAAGVTRPLTFTATLAEVTEAAVTVRAEAEIDRAQFGMTWNQLGMLRGSATISVVARFTRA